MIGTYYQSMCLGTGGCVVEQDCPKCSVQYLMESPGEWNQCNQKSHHPQHHLVECSKPQPLPLVHLQKVHCHHLCYYCCHVYYLFKMLLLTIGSPRCTAK